MDNLGKIIVTTGFEKLPKVQKIAQSDHTDDNNSRLSQQQVSTNWIDYYYINNNNNNSGATAADENLLRQQNEHKLHLILIYVTIF